MVMDCWCFLKISSEAMKRRRNSKGCLSSRGTNILKSGKFGGVDRHVMGGISIKKNGKYVHTIYGIKSTRTKKGSCVCMEQEQQQHHIVCIGKGYIYLYES